MEVQPHWRVCRWIERHIWDDKLMLLPRGTFKSSIGSVALPLWLLVHDRNLRILLSSGELANTKTWLSQITAILEKGPVFRALYGNWDENKRTETWHSTALSVAGRTLYTAAESITATSMRVTKVGQHYDFAFIDDLMNEKNVKQSEMIQAAETYIDLLLPILDPPRKIPGLPTPPQDTPGPRFLIGTRWHFDDAYGRTTAKDRAAQREGEPKQWRTYIRSCCAKARLIPKRQRTGRNKFLLTGPFFFPSRFSEKHLNKLQRITEAYEFSCQYLNDPMPEGTSVFNPAHFGFYWMEKDALGNWKGQRVLKGEVSPLPPALNFFTALDPSLGEHDDSDYCAFVTDAVDSAWNMYIAEVVEEHLIGNDAIIDEMFRIHAEWHPIRFGVESTQFQKSILLGFRAACRERNSWLNVQELKGSRMDKDLRIRGFEPHVVRGRFFLRVKAHTDLTLGWQDLYYALESGQESLADQMIRYPLLGRDDVIDAQAYIPHLMVPASDPAPPPKNDFTYTVMKEYWNRGPRRGGLLAPR